MASTIPREHGAIPHTGILAHGRSPDGAPALHVVGRTHALSAAERGDSDSESVNQAEDGDDRDVVVDGQWRVIVEFDPRDFRAAATVRGDGKAASARDGGDGDVAVNAIRGDEFKGDAARGGGGDAKRAPVRPFAWNALAHHEQHQRILARYSFLEQSGARCAPGAGNCSFVPIGKHHKGCGPHARLAFRASSADVRSRLIDEHGVCSSLDVIDSHMCILYPWERPRLTAFIGLTRVDASAAEIARWHSRGIRLIGEPLLARIASNQRYAFMRKFTATKDMLLSLTAHDRPTLPIIAPQRSQWRGCYRCGGPSHIARECKSPPKCANCGGAHFMGEMRDCPNGILCPCSICKSPRHRSNRCPQRQSFRVIASVGGGRYLPVVRKSDIDKGKGKGNGNGNSAVRGNARGGHPSRGFYGGGGRGNATDHRPLLSARPTIGNRHDDNHNHQFPPLAGNGSTARNGRTWASLAHTAHHSPPRDVNIRQSSDDALTRNDFLAILREERAAQERRTDMIIAQQNLILSAIIGLIPVSNSTAGARQMLLDVLKPVAKIPVQSLSSQPSPAPASTLPLPSSSPSSSPSRAADNRVDGDDGCHNMDDRRDGGGSKRAREHTAAPAGTDSRTSTGSTEEKKTESDRPQAATHAPRDSYHAESRDKGSAVGGLRPSDHSHSSLAAGAATLNGGNLSSNNTSNPLTPATMPPPPPPPPQSAFPPDHAHHRIIAPPVALASPAASPPAAVTASSMRSSSAPLAATAPLAVAAMAAGVSSPSPRARAQTSPARPPLSAHMHQGNGVTVPMPAILTTPPPATSDGMPMSDGPEESDGATSSPAAPTDDRPPKRTRTAAAARRGRYLLSSHTADSIPSNSQARAHHS